VSKELIYEGSVQAGYPVIFSVFGVDFTIFAILGWITSALTFICLIHVFYVMFMGKQKEEFRDVRDPPVTMMLPILIMVSLCIIIGVYPDLISGTLKYTADVLFQLRL
jgi:formate hydrogenlyase subunit 3/multisubunit Na+/H+ antiporter MnhD subunit